MTKPAVAVCMRQLERVNGSVRGRKKPGESLEEFFALGERKSGERGGVMDKIRRVDLLLRQR